MDWKKLKDNKCPQCTGSLKPNGRVLRCTKCEFLISTSKHGEIIRHLVLKIVLENSFDFDPDILKNGYAGTLIDIVPHTDTIRLNG